MRLGRPRENFSTSYMPAVMASRTIWRPGNTWPQSPYASLRKASGVDFSTIAVFRFEESPEGGMIKAVQPETKHKVQSILLTEVAKGLKLPCVPTSNACQDGSFEIGHQRA
jgi:hypothetical protein